LSQCEVCIVTTMHRIPGHSSDSVLHVQQPNDLAGLFRVAEARGAPGAGARLVASLGERMAAVESTARRVRLPTTRDLHRVNRALMSGGNWIPEFVAHWPRGVSLFG
jgi:hypothetical protein